MSVSLSCMTYLRFVSAQSKDAEASHYATCGVMCDYWMDFTGAGATSEEEGFSSRQVRLHIYAQKRARLSRQSDRHMFDSFLARLTSDSENKNVLSYEI
eukprot:scaffold667621_cov104-Prasinocladus_malaysianus.AAC.2